ncbi:MAG TPA: hypothetical protein VHE35_15120 [Kofleriaceae bacterium]|nr:hypothetical protein [Kofleriaceae bacterium]
MTAYRDDVAALAARHEALAAEVAERTRERDDAARILAEAKARARLPVLDNIRIASPCTAAWSAMVGDERVRHCGACDKDVFNLSAMTRDEAEALIVEKAGKLCARYFQRADGTILLADCAVGVKRRRRRRLVAAGTAALLAASGGLYAMRGAAKVAVPDGQTGSPAIMGDVEVTSAGSGSSSAAPTDEREALGAMDLPDAPRELQGGLAPIREPLPRIELHQRRGAQHGGRRSR